MTNTGAFYLLRVRLASPAGLPPQQVRVACVHAQCLQCRDVFTAEHTPALTCIPGGGAAIECPGCRNRQAIASEPFLSFLRWFPNGRTTAAPQGFAEQGHPR